MKQLLSLLIVFSISVITPVLSQEAGKDEAASDATAGAGKEKNTLGAGQGKERAARNVNVDAMMLYGQYNRLLWVGSLTQSFDTFTYQLNSDFKYSNDFGYRNSRYYENGVGFTGDADMTKKWRLTPQLEVSNQSHGMFRNIFYSREEKDRVDLTLNNVINPMPTRWKLNIGGVYFIHRLDSDLYPDIVTYRPYHSSDFYKLNAELGWDYIVSAANMIAFKSTFANYWYSAGFDDDTWIESELIWNFNVSEFLKFGMGPLYAYNRDGGHFPSGKINVTTLNIKYFSMEVSYIYEMNPFAPEQLYSEQRYVKPDYGLLPGKGHHVDANIGFLLTRSSDSPFYLNKVKIKGSGSLANADSFYSFFSLPEMVLVPHRMRVAQVRAEAEAAFGFILYSSYFEIGGKYEYSYFYASDYVTYRPEHRAGAYIRLAIDRFDAEFNTGYRGTVHVSPFFRMTMRPALTGMLTLQVKIYESFYLFGRIDNIYNSKYSTVHGYPEQGRSVIGGLRIII
ncbi:MAG: hypothetical protein JW807_10005 [Spirochaetes bacterium]|nr:hypothetical protein [Spirochaetota bacterium]